MKQLVVGIISVVTILILVAESSSAGTRRGAYGKVCKDECAKAEDRNYYICKTEPFTNSYGETRDYDLCSPRDGIDAYGKKCITECKVDERYGERYCGTDKDTIHVGPTQCSISA